MVHRDQNDRQDDQIHAASLVAGVVLVAQTLVQTGQESNHHTSLGRAAGAYKDPEYRNLCFDSLRLLRLLAEPYG